MRLLVIPFLILIAVLASGCASSDRCLTDSSPFSIEYYSGGGFTGQERGLTITSDGRVKKWTRSPGSDPVYTDSLSVRSADLSSLCRLMMKNDTLGYERSEKGNMTTVLTLTKNARTNIISFPGQDVPGDIPDYIVEIITTVRKINSY